MNASMQRNAEMTVPSPGFSGSVQTPQNEPGRTRLAAKDVRFWYGEKQILHGINLEMRSKEITALIGPSGCGKTTFLRMINRMCDTVDGSHFDGSIELDGRNILD